MATNGKTKYGNKIAGAKDGHVIWMSAGSDAGGETLAGAMTIIETEPPRFYRMLSESVVE